MRLRTGYKKFKEACRICRSWTTPYVESAIASARSGDSGSKKYTVLNELAKGTQDKGALTDNAMTLLVAGRDTTACLISWTVGSLLRRA